MHAETYTRLGTGAPASNYRVAMTNTRQCWRNYEYFMLKQCLKNIGEGLLHACISSLHPGNGTTETERTSAV
jgi:hypothetical protein